MTEGTMTLELPLLHEFIITHAELEMQAWHSSPTARDDLSLTLSLSSSILNHDPRKVGGEVTLSSSGAYDFVPMKGSWIFYEPDRFNAEVNVPEALLMRIWNCYVAKPEWLLFSLSDAPEPLAVRTHYEGEFRIGCRTGSTRSARED